MPRAATSGRDVTARPAAVASWSLPPPRAAWMIGAMAVVKVLTYNVHRGRSALRRRDVSARIGEILDFRRADVVCLQEVWQDEGFDAHRLEAHTGLWENRLFAHNVRFARGRQGNALLSRLAVNAWEQCDLSVPRREPRGVLHARLTVPGSVLPLSVFCVHLGLGADERLAQARRLKRLIEERVASDAPYVVLGDTNDWRGRLHGFFRDELGAREAVVEATGRLGRTYPAYLPVLALDRIYFRNCRLRVARVYRDARCVALSDHLPVEAELEL